MNKIEDAQERITAAQSDVEGDFGPDAWEQAAYDVIQGIAADYDRATRKEILRMELGIDLDADEKSDREYWAAEQLRLDAPLKEKRMVAARERIAEIRHELGTNRGDHR